MKTLIAIIILGILFEPFLLFAVQIIKIIKIIVKTVVKGE